MTSEKYCIQPSRTVGCFVYSFMACSKQSLFGQGREERLQPPLGITIPFVETPTPPLTPASGIIPSASCTRRSLASHQRSAHDNGLFDCNLYLYVIVVHQRAEHRIERILSFSFVQLGGRRGRRPVRKRTMCLYIPCVISEDVESIWLH
jgi:hypothetical protein